MPWCLSSRNAKLCCFCTPGVISVVVLVLPPLGMHWVSEFPWVPQYRTMSQIKSMCNVSWELFYLISQSHLATGLVDKGCLLKLQEHCLSLWGLFLPPPPKGLAPHEETTCIQCWVPFTLTHSLAWFLMDPRPHNACASACMRAWTTEYYSASRKRRLCHLLHG